MPLYVFLSLYLIINKMERPFVKTADEIRRLELESMKVENMTLGQFWEYSRYHKNLEDGYVVEQKIQRVIADEFIRLQAKVDIAYNG